MVRKYSHLYKIPTTGLHFFTVYGPWVRLEMTPILFVNTIAEEEAIKVINNGEMKRDFTYIDDIIEGIVRLIDKQPKTSSQRSVPYSIYNIGYGSPINFLKFIETIKNALGKKAKKLMMPMQEGDVKRTWADVNNMEYNVNYKSNINIKEGIKRFINWCIELYMTDK